MPGSPVHSVWRPRPYSGPRRSTCRCVHGECACPLEPAFVARARKQREERIPVARHAVAEAGALPQGAGPPRQLAARGAGLLIPGRARVATIPGAPWHHCARMRASPVRELLPGIRLPVHEPVLLDRQPATSRRHGGASRRPPRAAAPARTPRSRAPAPGRELTEPYSRCVQAPVSSSHCPQQPLAALVRPDSSSQRSSPVVSCIHRAASIVPGLPHISSEPFVLRVGRHQLGDPVGVPGGGGEAAGTPGGSRSRPSTGCAHGAAASAKSGAMGGTAPGTGRSPAAALAVSPAAPGAGAGRRSRRPPGPGRRSG